MLPLGQRACFHSIVLVVVQVVELVAELVAEQVVAQVIKLVVVQVVGQVFELERLELFWGLVLMVC